MFRPTSDQLHGVSYDKASLYGMSCIGSHYQSSNVDSNRLNEGARCAICGQMATNSHHLPPKGTTRTYLLRTPIGIHVLRPALIAVCGSGTTGCHGAFHQAQITAEWVWERDSYAEAWWSGELLRRMAPNSDALYELGHWELKDERHNGKIIYRKELS